jgi:hypothetical protein
MPNRDVIDFYLRKKRGFLGASLSYFIGINENYQKYFQINY